MRQGPRSPTAHRSVGLRSSDRVQVARGARGRSVHTVPFQYRIWPLSPTAHSLSLLKPQMPSADVKGQRVSQQTLPDAQLRHEARLRRQRPIHRQIADADPVQAPLQLANDDCAPGDCKAMAARWSIKPTLYAAGQPVGSR